MKLLIDASIPFIPSYLYRQFEVSKWNTLAELKHKIHTSEILVARSTLPINKTLLANTPIKMVATVTSGIDHIDSTYLRENDIACVDAKGANAEAVADYVISTLAVLKLEGSLTGNQVGIIGAGHVGSAVKKRLARSTFEVKLYDPLVSKTTPNKALNDIRALYASDVLLVHANLHDTPPYPSKNLIDSHFIQNLKPGTCIINASRGHIVNENDLLNSKNPLIYCTDVYANEPSINPRIVEFAKLCTPHIAGHTLEAKQNAIQVVCHKLAKLLKLEEPKFPKTHTYPPPTHDFQDWYELVLSIYDPREETNRLKLSLNLESDFKTVRNAHKHRHAFNAYQYQSISRTIRGILGIN